MSAIVGAAQSEPPHSPISVAMESIISRSQCIMISPNRCCQFRSSSVLVHTSQAGVACTSYVHVRARTSAVGKRPSVGACAPLGQVAEQAQVAPLGRICQVGVCLLRPVRPVPPEVFPERPESRQIHHVNIISRSSPSSASESEARHGMHISIVSVLLDCYAADGL